MMLDRGHFGAPRDEARAERDDRVPHAFFTNSDLSPIAPIPSILQSMS